MKIAFDMQPVLNNNKSGVGYHEDGLIRGLMQYFPENQYVFQYFSVRNRETKEKMINQYSSKAKKSELDCCRFFPGSLYRMSSALFPIPHRLFFRKKAEITHFFNFMVPPGVRGKKVVTIHDMAFRVYPETVRLKTKRFLQLTLKKSIRRADKIITVSEFSKKELMRFYDVKENKIAVVPNGVDKNRFHPDYTIEQKELVRKKYGIGTEKYLLYLGTIEPRKNLIRLLQAYRLYLEKEQAEPMELVLAGGKGWLCEDIFKEAEQDFSPGRVRMVGYVADEDVPVLLAGAHTFCFPSLYEGFGMPVLEAMACGTPIITSNVSSLPEVTQNAGVLVEPEDTEEIAEAMYQMVTQKELYQQYKEKGLERAELYSWENAVKRLYEIYQETVQQAL